MPAGILGSLTGTVSFWTEASVFVLLQSHDVVFVAGENFSGLNVCFYCVRLLVYLMSCLWTLHDKILKSPMPLGEKLVCRF